MRKSKYVSKIETKLWWYLAQVVCLVVMIGRKVDRKVYGRDSKTGVYLRTFQSRRPGLLKAIHDNCQV